MGIVIDRLGGRRAIVGGLLLLAAGALALPGALDGVALTSVALFGVGLGWSFAYVAATTELLDSARPTERGRLLGVSDLLSGLAGAGLTILAGYVLTNEGITAVIVGAAVLIGIAMLLTLGRLGPPA